LLKHNEYFIDHIRILVNSDKSGLQRATEGLLWKLETEEEAIAKSTNMFTNSSTINSRWF
jgi:hypothetical protein